MLLDWHPPLEARCRRPIEVSHFPSANYHPSICPLAITPYIYIYIGLGEIISGRLDYTPLDPKLAIEFISEVPGASKAHLEVVNGPVP